MSHLVSAEEPGDPSNRRQIEAFAALRQALPAVRASLANSSGIFLPQNPHHDLVRPGIALYGGNPTPERSNPMRPVVGLEARIIQVRTVEDGDTVGYNAQWTARGRRRLAVLSVGYADGYLRASGATDAKLRAGAPAGEAIVAGRRCPFAGRVSMDLIAVDITDVDETAVKRGDFATLIGGDLTVDEVGRRAGTISYEILTDLGRRYARIYRNGILMAKRQPSFICQSCGAVYNRWKGKCEACGGWNTIVEETGAANPMVGPAATRPSRAKGRVFPLEGLQGESKERRARRPDRGIRPRHRRRLRARLGDPARRRSGDRQVDAAHAGVRRSGEAATASPTSRARRRWRRCACAPSGRAWRTPRRARSETNVEDIVATLTQGRAPALAIIDSIQTMWTETVDSAPGPSPRCAAAPRR